MSVVCSGHCYLLQDYVSKLAVLLADAKNDAESEAGLEVQVRLYATAALSCLSCKKIVKKSRKTWEFIMSRRMHGPNNTSCIILALRGVSNP